MQLWANWSIAGIVTEARILTSDKNKAWRGYIIKVATLGQTFELSCDEGQFNGLSAGQHVCFEGHWEEQKGKTGTYLKLIVDRVVEVDTGEETAKSAAASKKAGAA